MDNESLSADIFIIGGGINGTGIIADAAGRGLKVILCEQNDLASGTSSKSTKLIHGGLRYLEQYDFGLVHKALKEREDLLHKAPHIITPLNFVLPYIPGLLPYWMMRIGLWLYDHLAKRGQLPPSHAINLSDSEYGQVLKSNLTRGFTYSDCWVDDARLVILNAIAAHEHQAQIITRQKVIHTERNNTHWIITTENPITRHQMRYTARFLINASGPWIKECNAQYIAHNPLHATSLQVELVKGSHIVVNRLFSGDQAYIFMHNDKRAIFVIPYLDRYTLIGTTDEFYTGNLNCVDIDPTEIQYLCNVVNIYFKQTLTADAVIWHYSGVRSLLAKQNDSSANPSTVSRDYLLQWETSSEQAPLVHIIGGKDTTYRVLAEELVNHLHPYFPQLGPVWTATTPLPGRSTTTRF